MTNAELERIVACEDFTSLERALAAEVLAWRRIVGPELQRAKGPHMAAHIQAFPDSRYRIDITVAEARELLGRGG